METTESAVKTATGDSGTANDSMMEVEEETTVPDLGANLQLPSTVGIDYTSTQDMEEEEEPMTAIQGPTVRRHHKPQLHLHVMSQQLTVGINHRYRHR